MRDSYPGRVFRRLRQGERDDLLTADELLDPVSGKVEPTHQNKILAEGYGGLQSQIYAVDCGLYAEYHIANRPMFCEINLCDLATALHRGSKMILDNLGVSERGQTVIINSISYAPLNFERSTLRAIMASAFKLWLDDEIKARFPE